jgi:lipopolysaccharide export system permease protein
MGRSLFSGIMIGLGFWIMNKAFTYFVPLFNIPPFIGAFLPTLLVCLLSIYMIRRIV